MQVLVFTAGFALLVSCIQFSYRLHIGALGKSGLLIGASDVGLLAGAVVLVILALRQEAAIKRLVPGWAVLTVIGAAIVCFVAGPSAAGVKELIQTIEILWVGYVLFSIAVRDGKGEELLSALFLAAALATAAVAIYQRLVKGTSFFEAGGLLENRNYLSAYLLLAVPWAAGKYLAPQAKARLAESIAAGLLVAASFFLAANIVVSFALFIGAAIAMAGHDVKGLAGSLTQKLSLGALAIVWIAATATSQGTWDGLAIYRQDVGGTMKPSARARRWQADMCAVSENPVFGLGLGKYQTEIGVYYRGAAIKPDGKTNDAAGFDLRADEPGTQGIWEVIPVEGGLVLTAAWMIMLTAGAVSAFRNERPGVTGALVAVLIAGTVVSVWMRGIGVALAFLLALAAEKPKSGQPPQ